MTVYQTFVYCFLKKMWQVIMTIYQTLCVLFFKKFKWKVIMTIHQIFCVLFFKKYDKL
jgi:hypothetical protein